MMSLSSSVLPEFDSAMTPSRAVIMPRSPWLASPGWTKRAGVPVEARVAAILRATWPLLPMPVTVTRPSIAARRATASIKQPSSSPASVLIARASTSSTRRATARSAPATAGGRGGLDLARIRSAVAHAVHGDPALERREAGAGLEKAAIEQPCQRADRPRLDVEHAAGDRQVGAGYGGFVGLRLYLHALSDRVRV